MLISALEAERAATEALKGAEQIAAAAEEQSSAVTEAQAAVEQQARSLEQGQIAAQGLAAIAEELRGGKRRDSSVEQISASAEELSASIQEMSGAAAQVMAGIEQVSKASQLQSAAVVDDSPLVRKLFGNVLAAETDMEVRFPRSGTETLAQLDEYLPHVVTLDVQMPGMDGSMPIDLLFSGVVMPGPLQSTELARKARERMPHLAVLFTSG